MSSSIVQQRLEQYHANNTLEEEYALKQAGPWQDKKLQINKAWVVAELEKKVKLLNWEAVAKDVIQFLKPQEQKSLAVWGKEFFLSRLEKLR